MLTRIGAVCAAGLFALGLSVQSADAMMALPKKLNIPTSTAMSTGPKTLAPFAHVRFCKSNPAQCSVSGGRRSVAMTDEKWRQLSRVNSIVNRAIRPVHDRKIGALADHWTLNPRAGDCEDYALTKRAKLLRMGWPSSSLLIATAYAPRVGHHAVLVVRTNKGDYVLDNLRRQIKPWRKTGYRWHKMQSPKNPRYWVKV